MNKKIVIVTGANSGIGKETATRLAQQGYHVILGCRNLVKGQKALDSILKIPNTSAELMIIDLMEFASIRHFVEEFKQKYDHLDVLINNAGVLQLFYGETPEKFERHLQINYLGHFLLTMLLLDSLDKAEQGRIIMLSSCAHAWTYVHFDNINLKHHYTWTTAYGQSKLCNLLFAQKLTEHLKNLNSKVTINALHPGIVATNIVVNRKTHIGTIIAFLCNFVMIHPNKGARTSIFLATNPDVKNISGKYFYKCKEKEPGKNASNLEASTRLFNQSCDWVGISADEIFSSLK